MLLKFLIHDDVIKCHQHFPRNWSFVTGEFPSQRPVTRSFDVFLDLRLNKRLSKQTSSRWFEAPWGSLLSHCNVYDFVTTCVIGCFIWFYGPVNCLIFFFGKNFKPSFLNFIRCCTVMRKSQYYVYEIWQYQGLCINVYTMTFI